MAGRPSDGSPGSAGADAFGSAGGHFRDASTARTLTSAL